MSMLDVEILEYLGMTKNKGQICAIVGWWEDVFAITAGVCISHGGLHLHLLSLDYLNWIKPKIGIMPTQGFCE